MTTLSDAETSELSQLNIFNLGRARSKATASMVLGLVGVGAALLIPFILVVLYIELDFALSTPLLLQIPGLACGIITVPLAYSSKGEFRRHVRQGNASEWDKSVAGMRIGEKSTAGIILGWIAIGWWVADLVSYIFWEADLYSIYWRYWAF